MLAREKEHTRLGDEIAQLRRELPWGRVEKECRFDTGDGARTLAELFDGRSQLLGYHFMFGPSYESGDPVNSSIADAVDGIVSHGSQRKTLKTSSTPTIETKLADRSPGHAHARVVSR